MKYPGGLAENLLRAVRNSRKQRDEPLSPVTIDYWREMISEAMAKIQAGGRSAGTLTRLVFELNEEIVRRGNPVERD